MSVMKYHLKAPRTFDGIEKITRFCLPTDSQLIDKDAVLIDLSDLHFIKPMGVIGILLLVESITKNNINTKIILMPPKNSEVLDYLLKVNIIPALNILGKWKIPKGTTASGRRIKPVIPITRFKSSQEIEDIANQMEQTFAQKFSGLSSLLQPCHLVFSELADNVIQHANSSGGFVLAQQYDYSEGTNSNLQSVIVIGIHTSLKQSTKLKGIEITDEDAIGLVLRGGISRMDDPYRGFGISHVKDELTHSPDRSLTLRSGNVYAILYAGEEPVIGTCNYFPGTLVHAVIPC